jgi:hypothetical protein
MVTKGIIQSIAQVVDGPTTCVDLCYRDFDSRDVGFAWRISVAGLPGKRPPFICTHEELDEAVLGTLRQIAEWKYPDRSEQARMVMAAEVMGHKNGTSGGEHSR